MSQYIGAGGAPRGLNAGGPLPCPCKFHSCQAGFELSSKFSSRPRASSPRDAAGSWTRHPRASSAASWRRLAWANARPMAIGVWGGCNMLPFGQRGGAGTKSAAPFGNIDIHIVCLQALDRMWRSWSAGSAFSSSRTRRTMARWNTLDLLWNSIPCPPKRLPLVDPGSREGNGGCHSSPHGPHACTQLHAARPELFRHASS